MEDKVLKRVLELLEPTVQGLGYELVGAELLPVSGRYTLRVYIDAEQGIGVDDCQAVSEQVSGVLDVDDPIKGQYALEVSSPGIERPLFKAADFERFAGEIARIQLKQALQGRKNFKGILRGLRDDAVVMELDGEQWSLPLALIRRANLAPDF